mgnify:CR=1 FL=1
MELRRCETKSYRMQFSNFQLRNVGLTRNFRNSSPGEQYEELTLHSSSLSERASRFRKMREARQSEQSPGFSAGIGDK